MATRQLSINEIFNLQPNLFFEAQSNGMQQLLALQNQLTAAAAVAGRHPNTLPGGLGGYGNIAGAAGAMQPQFGFAQSFASSPFLPQGLGVPQDLFQGQVGGMSQGHTSAGGFSHNGPQSLRDSFAPAPTDLADGAASNPDKKSAKLAGRHPVALYMSCDEDSLSEYQCLVRNQIELFEARREEVESNAKGRNKPIVLGQVGIRCRHCSMLPPRQRARGAMYYPAKLNGLYQAAQSMASGHLCYHCQHIPVAIRQELLVLRERKSSAGGGKKYWGDGVRIIGVFEDEDGLRFDKR
jgi:hypothetical protein